MNESKNIRMFMDLDVDYATARTCLAIVELYLNRNDTECLAIENNEPGAWNLAIKNWREVEED